MIYSELYLKDRFRIPTVVVLIFVFILIVFFARFFTNSSIPTKASNRTVKRMEITNLSPYQVTAFWQTDKKEKGWILLGDDKNRLTQTYLDERDTTDNIGQYINHYFILRDLKSSHQYYFKVIGYDQMFSFSTPVNSQTVSNLNPAYGKVVGNNDQAMDNAVVLIFIDKFSPLSTLTKSTGEWLIPLNSIKSPGNDAQVRIEVISEDGLVSNITTNITKLSPIPETIIIGKNYNFTDTTQNVLGATANNVVSPVKKMIDIEFPSEGMLIPGQNPLIKGSAIPKSTVNIVIHSEKSYSARVTTDDKGDWTYKLPENLALGKHTITITTKDGNGQNLVITRNFTIIGYEGADARVLGVATNDPVVSGAPTSTPNPIATAMPTYPPLSPTTFVASPSAPVTGGSNFMIPAIGGASLMIIGVGIILAF